MKTLFEGLIPAEHYCPDPLFGPMTRQVPAEFFFLPMWQAVERLAGPEFSSCTDTFSPGALSSFRDDFLFTAVSIWQAAIETVVKRLAGPMGRSWKKWLEESLLPLLESGELYQTLAMEYSVFERQAVVMIRDAAAHLTAFSKTVSSNQAAILSLLPSEDPQAAQLIAAVHSVHSDRHNHGLSVHILEFESGSRLVWKPQNMKLDRAWNRWLKWLLSKAGQAAFPTVRSLDLSYGCVCSYLEPSPLRSEEDAALYFKRAGFLMGAAYLLGGNDCHWENVIACGAYPVLIDTETVLYCKTSVGELKDNGRYHILRTSMLPYTGSGPGLYPGGSALCSNMPGGKNLPRLFGSLLTGYDYPQEIYEGFTKALTVCMEHREEASSLAAGLFTGCTYRTIMRPTRYYASLLFRLGSSAALKSEKDYEARLSGLENRYTDKLTDPAVKELLRVEKESLFRLDLPIFQDTVDSKKAEELKNRILSTDRHTLEMEQDIIRFLLAKHTINEKNIIPKPDTPSGISIPEAEEMVDRLCRVMTDSMGVVADRKGDLYLGVPMSPMMEGGLGAAVALSAGLRIRPHRQAEEILKRYSEAITTKRHLLSGGMSAQEPGLCEGIGGCITGLCFLEACGRIPKDFLLSFLGRLDELNLLQRYLMYNQDTSLGYGLAGLLFGIKQIPEEDLKGLPGLSQIKGRLLQSLAMSDPAPVAIREADRTDSILHGQGGVCLALGKAKWPDLFPDTPEKTVFTNHMALAGGMAGLLLAETSRRIEKEAEAPSSYEHMCAAALMQARYPATPVHIGSCGLLLGEAGRVYALARYLDPVAVPAIF